MSMREPPSGEPGNDPDEIRLRKNESHCLSQIPDDADPRIAELLDYWHRSRDEGSVPDRRAFDPLNLLKWLGFCSVYEYKEERDDFLNRLEGTFIVDITGQNWTGRYASDVDSHFGSRFQEELKAVRAARLPAIDLVQIFQNDFGQAIRLLLPVSKSDGIQADQVFVAMFARSAQQRVKT